MKNRSCSKMRHRFARSVAARRQSGLINST